MSSHPPRVSVALPVFNGENYLAEALDSLLTQTYRDFEVIISDNGSTDRTQEICRGYVERDPRVSYLRSEVNRGVYWNFRRGFECTQGEFFMWLAHDDKLAPEFLERCVAALDHDPGAVLSYPKAIDIDEQGNHVMYKEQELNGGASKPHERFRGLISMEHNCEAIFALIRIELLRKIQVFGNFADADRVMLAELSLHGRYSQIPDFLFLHREHQLRATNVYPQSRFQRTAVLLSFQAGENRIPTLPPIWRVHSLHSPGPPLVEGTSVLLLGDAALAAAILEEDAPRCGARPGFCPAECPGSRSRAPPACGLQRA